jgi:hypothetical protein
MVRPGTRRSPESYLQDDHFLIPFQLPGTGPAPGLPTGDTRARRFHGQPGVPSKSPHGGSCDDAAREAPRQG